MNEPIISPWLVYLIGVVGDVKVVSIIVSVMLGITLIVLLVYWWIDHDFGTSWKNISKPFCRLLVGLSVSLFIAVLVPNQSTLIGMVVVSQVTPARVEQAVKSDKVLKDELKRDLIDVIKAVRGEPERKAVRGESEKGK